MPDTALTLHIPDMSCGHCRASITAALAPLGLEPVFDMAARQITLPVTDPVPVIAALERIGFPASPAAG